MNANKLMQMGIPAGPPVRAALGFISRYCLAGNDKAGIEAAVEEVVRNPQGFQADPLRSEFAEAMMAVRIPFVPGDAPWRQWGEGLEAQAVEQMIRACRLPVSLAGALMPDAHVGYGLPIGGVLATAGVVIPFAVGVDIACRMKLSVFDWPVESLETRQADLIRAIEEETSFGVGARSRRRHEHPVLDEDWSFCKPIRANRDKARAQIGTSGSGNHFVEFGELTVRADPKAGPDANGLGLQAGRYLALLSHSGSRGTGAAVCDHYSRLAAQMHPELPREFQRLAWLGLGTEEGQEYWAAMELMGRYASANHALIHQFVARNLGAQVVAGVENHHNFAWKETHRVGGVDREVVVHRKGATPAHAGVLGVIPGSMATPGFVVRGLGGADSLGSASHGAGRVMSRTKAEATFRWEEVEPVLRERRVKLLSAGIDEVPMVYKDIHQVMAAQSDLVEVLAEFQPRLVKMAPSGERPED